MHKLLQRQIAKATRGGQVDVEALADLVSAAYSDADRDRIRTDRSLRLMSDELHQANLRLLEAFDIVPEGLVLLDAQDRYVLFNRRFIEIYDTIRDTIAVGASFAESLRAGVERGHFPEAIGREEAWLAERLRQNRGERNSSEEHVRANRWVRVEEHRTADGGSIGAHIDITDLKRREQALIRRSEQLIEAQRLGRIGDWSYRFGQPNLWWSPQVFELLHYDPATFRPTRQATLSLPVGEGAHRILKAQAAVLRTGLIQTVDVRLKRGDGSIGDFAVINKLLKDDQDRPIGLRGTIQDISERKSAEQSLEKLAFYDPLTGLANRALFQRKVKEAFIDSQRSGVSAALLILDLDRFKEVNDSFGHAAGDQVLVTVAHLISRILKNNHVVARLGGDEFAIIVAGGVDRAMIEGLAGEAIAAIDRPIMLERGEVNIGTSIGIAMMPADGPTLADLQRNADLALYRAKEDGRGRYRFFDAQMSDVVLHKIAVARDLHRAVQTGSHQLAVHYQPQVDLTGPCVTGYEALIRWTHPSLGSVPPAEFIPIAESSRLICDLGLWVLRQAAVQAKAWLEAGERAREVAVNVSPAQIWQSDFADDVARVLEETALPPHLLCLELTESLLVDHSMDRVQNVLTKLKRRGVTLALDDFGTHYSSLGYLTQLPFDKLKIDRIFVRGIAESERARNLLEGIIALGHGLGMSVIVEGAEKLCEVEILRKLRADLVQGFVFAHPAPAPQALSFARSMDRKGHQASPIMGAA